MDRYAQEALATRARCLVAVPGDLGAAPAIVPAPSWSDGAALWLAVPVDDGLVAELERDPACAVVLPPAGDRRVTVAAGRARVYSPGDPLGLVLHAPTILAATAALAAHHTGELSGWVGRAVRSPARLLPRDRVVVRVALRDVRVVEPPAPPPGIGPALPTAIPAEVRRGLAGTREVVLATPDGADLVVIPAVWSAGFRLTLPPGVDLAAGTPVTAACELPTPDGSGPVAGLALAGTVGPGPVLIPRRARWWTDGTRDEAEVPAARPLGAVTLPD